MHRSVKEWVADQVDTLSLAGASVLEVGSLDVNGSVRNLFRGEYVGLDMREGKGVDVVADASDLPFADRSFGVVVSTEMLEHCLKPYEAVREMGRVLTSRGELLLTARGPGFPRHGYPNDYWRFTEADFSAMMHVADVQCVDVRQDPEFPGVFGLGVKHGRTRPLRPSI